MNKPGFPLQACLDFLREQGFAATADEDGDIAFTANGREVVLFTTQPDPRTLRLGTIVAADPDEPRHRTRLLEACSQVASRSKLAKAYLVDDATIAVTVEQLVLDPAQFAGVFPICLAALGAGAAACERFLRRRLPERPVARA